MRTDEEIIDLVKNTKGGFMKLSGEEKTHYSASLKGVKEVKEEVKEEAKEEKKEPENFDTGETITISKSDLSSLINDAIKQKEVEEPELGDWQKYNPAKSKNRTCKLALYQVDGDSPSGVVVDYKYLRKEYNEETRKNDHIIYRITVKYEDGVKEHEVNWKKFNLEDKKMETAEIIETKREKIVRNHGRVAVAHREKGYIYSSLLDLSVEGKAGNGFVDQLEIADRTTFKIKRKNGDILSLPDTRINL